MHCYTKAQIEAEMRQGFRLAQWHPTGSTLDVERPAMERSDSRMLPVAVLNERRRRAAVLRLNGMTR